MENTQSAGQMSRRNFLTGFGAAAATALAVPSMLSMTGCAQPTLASEIGPASHNESEIYTDIFPVKTRNIPVVDEETYLTKHGNIGFERRQIAASEITRTWDTDVLVVGLGISGICAVLSASERSGVKVLGLEKETHPRMVFESVGACNCKVQLENNNVVDPVAYRTLLLEKAEYRVSWEPIRSYVSRSGEALDWLADQFAKGKTGITMTQRVTDQTVPTDMAFGNTTGVNAGSPAMYIIPDLTATAEKRSNVELHTSTAVVQLVKEEGKVVGAIAKDKDGYIRVNAKSVILATGGYEMNPQMLKAWVRPEDLASLSPWTPGTGATGDGHMMGLQIGAAMDPVPHAIMNFAGGNPEGMGLNTGFGMTAKSGCWVNEHGLRFANEAVGANQWRANQLGAQAHGGRGVWGIFADNNYPHNDVADHFAPILMEKGFMVEADSIAELAEKIGVPKDNLVATVKRFNSLVEKGVDEDFDSNFRTKKKIEGKKYYAYKYTQTILTTVSGLKIDGEMRVLDYEHDAIPGLFAVGNCSGNFFYSNYPRDVAGISIGRCVTFGYLAGKTAAKEA